MKTSFLILAVICMPLLIHTSEFVQRWVRATHKDSIRAPASPEPDKFHNRPPGVGESGIGMVREKTLE